MIKIYGCNQIVFAFFILVCLCFKINDYYERKLMKAKIIEVNVLSKECKTSSINKNSNVSVLYFNVNRVRDSVYVSYEDCNAISNSIKVVKSENEYLYVRKNFFSYNLIIFLSSVFLVSIVPFKKFFKK